MAEIQHVAGIVPRISVVAFMAGNLLAIGPETDLRAALAPPPGGDRDPAIRRLEHPGGAHGLGGASVRAVRRCKHCWHGGRGTR